MLMASGLSLSLNCYQEFANVSTNCGGLNTGTYSVSTLSNDGNWSSYEGIRFYVNYTIPESANLTYSFIESLFNSEISRPGYPQNNSLNITNEIGYSCGDGNVSILQLWYEPYPGQPRGFLYCMTPAGFREIRPNLYDGQNYSLAEEGIWWNITYTAMANGTVVSCDGLEPNITISLLYLNGTQIKSTTSDENGMWYIAIINSGEYQLTANKADKISIKRISTSNNLNNIKMSFITYCPDFNPTQDFPKIIYDIAGGFMGGLASVSVEGFLIWAIVACVFLLLVGMLLGRRR